MEKSVRAAAFLAVFAAIFGLANKSFAASYFLISDESLAERSPVAVRATALASRVLPAGGFHTETRTTFSVEEVVRGTAGRSIDVALPGGTLPSGAGSYAWMPEFRAGSDYVLFLARRSDGIYGVVELELGIFEVQYDGAGAALAVRPRFSSSASASRSLDSAGGLPAERPRELRAFLAKIAGGVAPDPAKPPAGLVLSVPVTGIGGQIRPMWNNLGSILARWPTNASISAGYVDDDTTDEIAGGPGPQANLTGGGGGLPQLQNAVSHWNSDSSSSINISLSAGSKSVTIHADNVSEFSGGTGIPCGLGVVGLTIVSWSSANQTFKSQSYRTILGADVYLRRWDCLTNTYLPSAFENVATHELGHALGLDHPDQATSPHDHTPNDVSDAVMISTGSYTRHTGLGSDDVEGICWLYGACADTVAPPPPPPPPPPPTGGCQAGANTLCLQGGRFRVSVAWQALNQGTSGNGTAIPLTGDTGAFWFFDPSNLELTLKVLDGRPINGHFWVFYGALSNVQYTITVTDTQTGAIRKYTNPQNTMASVGDVAAF